MLQELNDTNNASYITNKYYSNCLEEFKSEHLYGAEFGVAYGGGIYKIGKTWENRGTVWGFDTFEEHPKELRFKCQYTKKIEEEIGRESEATSCMDHWYKNPLYGLEKLKYNYIQSKLKEDNIYNVLLVKGIVNSNTNIDFIPKLHYALIDFDFPIAQWDAYNLIKYKIVKNGYLCLHDMIPEGHIYGNYKIYQKILSENLFNIICEIPESFLCVLQKK